MMLNNEITLFNVSLQSGAENSTDERLILCSCKAKMFEKTYSEFDELTFALLNSNDYGHGLVEFEFSFVEKFKNPYMDFYVSCFSFRMDSLKHAIKKNGLKYRNRAFNKNKIMFLVLPELCYPVYWLNDLIRFAKRTNIGIITGLQYLKDDKNRIYNYIATILPFTTGKKKYRNTFLYIREKNDYSPIEFENLAKLGYTCKNRGLAEYPIFNWKGIRLSPMLCYEFTDIVARAHLKGRCDFIAAPVFNPDTTYFSNIIDSTARDLHAFVVQANTSFYGDSRVTGPYDRDSKDIFKIKGGDNDHVVIGAIDFVKYKRFQDEYKENFNQKLKLIEKERIKKKPHYPKKDSDKPNLKPLSARFQIKD